MSGRLPIEIISSQKHNRVPISLALHQNERLRVAVLDFGGNLLGAISNTLEGLGVIFPYPFIAYRGWIGGIVSIDSLHLSRLAEPQEAAYYLITLTLQLIPSIPGRWSRCQHWSGEFQTKTSIYQGEKWLGISEGKASIRDAI